jgi:rod shape-determining protein MreC
MAGRPSNWGWNPTGRRRYALIALWCAHGAWVTWSRVPGQAWQSAGSFLSTPFQAIAGRMHRWRVDRAQRITDLAVAQAEVNRLRAELERRQTEDAKVARTLTEAEEAARLLGLKTQVPLTLQAARIIHSTRQGPFGGYILDQGQDAGLKPDQGVFAPEGVVGRVWSVGPTQSKVLPADAPNAAISVMLARSRATGILMGLGRGRGEIRYVSNQEVVQAGEAIYTSGLDRVFPRGLLVGWVQEVSKGDLELRIRMQLSAPLDRLHLVLLLPPQPPLEVQAPSEGLHHRPEPTKKRGA